MSEMGGAIMDELSNRVLLNIDKKNILQCIRRLKSEKEAGVSWLVSQPSLYDVFVHFAN